MIYDCLLCGAKRPVSHVRVWKDGKVYGCLCGSHLLREVILAGYDVDVTLEQAA